MKFILKLVGLIVLAAVLGAVSVLYWARQPILPASSAVVPFEIAAGSSVRSSARQIALAGIPLNPWLFEALARASGKGARLKAGFYELKPGTTPRGLITQMVRGEFAQESLTVIEGWTFAQMRQAVAAHPALKHDTLTLSDSELLARISTDFQHPEGLFFPDTYLFAKRSSEMQIYKQAYAQMMQRLNQAWEARDPSLPYQSPYDALKMASIVEKETGRKSERNMIAAVFVNRLKLGMPLQTDPTVIYGMGERFGGNIRKKDLQTDTPYNTYLRLGLPPTPISLPGAESLAATFNPAPTDALYFVARGDGSSYFSNNLDEHNRAVGRYQLGQK
ncbi:MAG: hypothetical protein K0S28_442 [Paucimonas sp.]|jgi:UPF0755 protein|nr:hypothetical protein [Paucimonas sp.]